MVKFLLLACKLCDMKNEKNIEVLNDLIKINNDRIAGYEKAAENIDQSEVMLKTLFYQLAEESQEFKRELGDRVTSLGGEPASDSTAPGKVYRLWMDIKSGFSGNDRKSILESCEFGEDAAQRAYKMALEDRDELPFSSVQLIEDQKALLRMSHDLIRNQRDEYREMAKK
jgi:uncharacterized protein (TIGR02284 family)